MKKSCRMAKHIIVLAVLASIALMLIKTFQIHLFSSLMLIHRLRHSILVNMTYLQVEEGGSTAE